MYVKGQKISLVATPLPNYQLSSWSIAGESVDLGKKDTLTVTVGADRTYSANFTPILHKVSIETFGDASGDLKVTTPDDQAADGQKPVSNGDELQQGSILQIAAIPEREHPAEIIADKRGVAQGRQGNADRAFDDQSRIRA